MTKIKPILPGLIVSFIIAVISQGLALVIPNLGGATIAIIVGIILGNTIIKQPILNKGTHYSEKALLEYSVVLLGLTISFQTIAKVGWVGFLFVIIQMAITIISAILIGKMLHFKEGIYLLMAGGNAVCGSSAIASIAPVIDANDEDKEMVITLVNLIGTVLMLALPIISTFAFGANDLFRGAMIGGTIQSVGQVIASASMVNSLTVDFATLFKIMRIMMIVIVVFIFGWMHQKTIQNELEADAEISGNGSGSSLPWYVVGFLVFCVLNSLIHLPSFIGLTAHTLSSWCEITALAAIGLRLNLKAFIQSGKKFLIYGGSIGLIQIVASIILITLLLK